ncbi:LysR family transcriptional regulator [Microlunatus parietis]|uniref:DNA-binding transcriptional LysR family regulator n=1 Tax=Microlunatus parietis TaxID=682979 RepID=A0A7Y9I954_9ACTN|nr:LysR family transcriptional regulator [Microlunatus parietis]NYE72624.1 DNA-binding transcriptional LysR family regulator [Microlunatus parietis]
MDTRAVEGFVAVAERLHFGQAATELHLSQPALSGRIAALEREVGARLLDRNRRQVALTEAGRTFLPLARAMLEAARTGVTLARRAVTGEAGRLRLGFTVIAGFTELPRRVQEFRRRHPDVVLELTEVDSPSVERALAEGRIDLGVLHPPVSGPRLAVADWRSEPLLLALPDGHPLLAQERLTFADLAGEPWLVGPRVIGPVIYDRLIAGFSRAGVRPEIVQEVYPMPVLVSLVAAGAGVGFVTAGIASAGRPGVAYRPVVDAPDLPVAAAWLGDRPIPTAVRFLETCGIRTDDP